MRVNENTETKHMKANLKKKLNKKEENRSLFIYLF
jgi:hypothetical protein